MLCIYMKCVYCTLIICKQTTDELHYNTVGMGPRPTIAL